MNYENLFQIQYLSRADVSELSHALQAAQAHFEKLARSKQKNSIEYEAYSNAAASLKEARSLVSGKDVDVSALSVIAGAIALAHKTEVTGGRTLTVNKKKDTYVAESAGKGVNSSSYYRRISSSTEHLLSSFFNALDKANFAEISADGTILEKNGRTFGEGTLADKLWDLNRPGASGANWFTKAFTDKAFDYSRYYDAYRTVANLAQSGQLARRAAEEIADDVLGTSDDYKAAVEAIYKKFSNDQDIVGPLKIMVGGDEAFNAIDDDVKKRLVVRRVMQIRANQQHYKTKEISDAVSKLTVNGTNGKKTLINVDKAIGERNRVANEILRRYGKALLAMSNQSSSNGGDNYARIRQEIAAKAATDIVKGKLNVDVAAQFDKERKEAVRQVYEYFSSPKGRQQLVELKQEWMQADTELTDQQAEVKVIDSIANTLDALDDEVRQQRIESLRKHLRMRTFQNAVSDLEKVTGYDSSYIVPILQYLYVDAEDGQRLDYTDLMALRTTNAPTLKTVVRDIMKKHASEARKRAALDVMSYLQSGDEDSLKAVESYVNSGLMTTRQVSDMKSLYAASKKIGALKEKLRFAEVSGSGGVEYKPQFANGTPLNETELASLANGIRKYEAFETTLKDAGLVDEETLNALYDPETRSLFKSFKDYYYNNVQGARRRDITITPAVSSGARITKDVYQASGLTASQPPAFASVQAAVSSSQRPPFTGALPGEALQAQLHSVAGQQKQRAVQLSQSNRAVYGGVVSKKQMSNPGDFTGEHDLALVLEFEKGKSIGRSQISTGVPSDDDSVRYGELARQVHEKEIRETAEDKLRKLELQRARKEFARTGKRVLIRRGT